MRYLYFGPKNQPPLSFSAGTTSSSSNPDFFTVTGATGVVVGAGAGVTGGGVTAGFGATVAVGAGCGRGVVSGFSGFGCGRGVGSGIGFGFGVGSGGGGSGFGVIGWGAGFGFGLGVVGGGVANGTARICSRAFRKARFRSASAAVSLSCPRRAVTRRQQLMSSKVGNRTAADANGGVRFANFHS